MDPQHILEIVYEAIDETNESIPGDRHLAKTLETALAGDDSHLDSIDLATLVMEIEDRLSARVGSTVKLLDDDAVAAGDGPFKSVESLVEYVGSLPGVSDQS